MSHKCNNLLVHCMDFRLQKDIFEWMQKEGFLGDTDIVSVAGAGAEFLSAENRNFMLKQVRLSKELHSMTRVIFANHTDCGAYGGKSAFNDAVEEEQKHIADMQNMATIIKNEYPELEVKLVLIKMIDSGNIFEAI